MDRRNFLKGSSAAAALAGTATATAANAAKAADDARALESPSVLSGKRTLRMVSLWAEDVTGAGDHVRRFAKRIEAASDGHLVIEVDDVPPAHDAEAFNSVMTGDADLYVGHEHAHRDMHPAFSYFAGLPCRTGLRADRFNAWLMAAGGQDLWDELAGEFNMKGLVIGHSGRSRSLFTRQPLQSRADLHGKRIAAMGLAADVLMAVDAIPMQRTAASHTSLAADSTLDGFEAVGADIELGLQQMAGLSLNSTFAINPPLNTNGYFISLGLRRSFWDGLRNSEQLLLHALSCEAAAASHADLYAQTLFTRQLTRTFAPPPGKLNATSQANRISIELRRIAESIVADISGHDDFAGRINASYMAFKHAARPTGTV
ncbi:MAG: twin-arginine translocation signal domain-containing protein [Hyphomicrobiaceae bacterium]